MAVSIGVGSVLHPGLLVSLGGWAVAHDHTPILLSANNAILSVLSVLVLILRDRSVECPRSVMTFLIDLLLN